MVSIDFDQPNARSNIVSRRRNGNGEGQEAEMSHSLSMRRGKRQAGLGLFFGQIADYGQFDPLVVIGRVHQVQPQGKEAQTDERV
jgi:hypothetical protein